MKMTEGNPLSIMVRFALPLMLGDLFQQLYIAVDSGIVGRFAEGEALAAIGSTTYLIRLVIGLFIGISAGAGVVISQAVGANDEKRASMTIHTMAGLTLMGGLVLSLIGVICAKMMLVAVGTPQDVLVPAVSYLRIYFFGVLFELTYNVGSGVLQSYGNSKVPFIILVIGSVANIVMDLLFVVVFHAGIQGAAVATVLSQVITAALVVVYMMKSEAGYRFMPKRINLNKDLVPVILKMGLPAGLQGSIVALSNILVQYNINKYGSDVVAGFGLFNKIDGVLFVYISGIGLATMTFTGQNFGAGNMKRIRKGIYSMVFLQMLGWLFGFMICFLFDHRIVSIFTDNPQIIRSTLDTMWVLVPGYFLMGISWSLTNVIRAVGYSFEASLISILNMCVVRQIWIMLSNMLGLKLFGILLSYPISWAATLAAGVFYALYLKGKMLSDKKDAFAV